jgi:hypothetical protein
MSNKKYHKFSHYLYIKVLLFSFIILVSLVNSSLHNQIPFLKTFLKKSILGIGFFFYKKR